MRVMILVKATDDSEKTEFDLNDPWTREMMEAMGKFNDELEQAGILVEVGGLKPSSQARRIVFDGPTRTVVEGPFEPARELVAGFWIWDVKDLDEAIAWVKRCPNPMRGPSEIEIRPFHELDHSVRDNG